MIKIISNYTLNAAILSVNKQNFLKLFKIWDVIGQKVTSLEVKEMNEDVHWILINIFEMIFFKSKVKYLILFFRKVVLNSNS